MNNCMRCCFFEFCSKTGRTENKKCVYGQKEENETSLDKHNRQDKRSKIQVLKL